MKRRIGSAVLGLTLSLWIGGCLAPVVLPTALFTSTPSSGQSPLVVTFDASGSQAPGGTITDYSWDYGDGTTGNGMTAAHTFVTEVLRTFVVTLRVTDHLGQQTTTSASIAVSAPEKEEGLPPVAFTWPFHYDAVGDDALNLNDEYFTIENTGSVPVDLSGWTVENERGTSLQFPSGTTLAPHATLYVHSGAGTNAPDILYWNASEPIWNDTSDLAVLRNAEGTIIDFYFYHSC